MKKINIGLLGFGNVGSGTYETLYMNKEHIEKKSDIDISVSKILVRNLEKYKTSKVPFELFTDNPDDILEDENIDIVVEVLGGVEPATSYMIKALENGKHVVTANKAAVASNFNLLQDAAVANDVVLKMEGCVAGGIPILNALTTVLKANQFIEILGILNGTTNYILPHMEKESLSFDDVLREAQRLGYAEKNPASDIEGTDTCRKLAILSSIAYDNYFDYKEIKTEGITNIDINDMLYAKAIDKKIKLLGFSKKEDGENTFAIVAPFLISNNNPLYNVNDVLNAILVHGNAVNDVMYYGSGAGKLPTASAVVSDIVEIAKNIDRHIPLRWNSEKLELSDIKDIKFRYFVRIKGNKNEMQDELEHIFGSLKKVISLDEIYGEFAVITNYMSENRFNEVTKDLDCVLNRIRIFNENK